MTDINTQENIYPAEPTPSPMQNPDLFDFFAFVVDGEVAVTFAAHKQYMANYIAAWSSNPKTVILSNDQKNIVGTGWIYNEQTGAFTQPA